MSTRSAERTPYEEHRDYVLAVLRRRCGWLDPSDREALFHDAYAVFLEKQQRGQLDTSVMLGRQVRAYLAQTSLNKAMDEGKRAGRRRTVALDDQLLEPADPGLDVDERLASKFDDARVREIVAELPDRQQLVVKLRFFLHRDPAEIQRYLGVTERVYRRELERATRHIAERFHLVKGGTFCEGQRSLILAYVTRVSGPTRREAARRHLESCPACAHWASELRCALGRAAAVLPPPALAVPLVHPLILRARGLLGAARGRPRELGAVWRDHVSRVVVRVDPTSATALSTFRPGAAVMLAAGCLATTSGAAYCVLQGVPGPLRSVFANHHPSPAPRRASRRRPEPAPAPGVVRATVAQSRPPVRPRLDHAAVPRARATNVRASVSRARSTATPSTPAERAQIATSARFGAGAGVPVSAPHSTPQSARGDGPPPSTKAMPEFDP